MAALRRLVWIVASSLCGTSEPIISMVVIVMTRLFNQFLLDLAIKNGAQAAFHKTAGSGDMREPSIVKAISIVQLRNRLVS